MAIYTTSDLHGYPLTDFLSLLGKAGFGENDFLFVLGDVVDRNGDGGLSLLAWMMARPNVKLIMGNHERMMLDSAWSFEAIDGQSTEKLKSFQLESLELWMFNGGDVTAKAVRKMLRENPSAVNDIFSFLNEAPLYETVCVNGRNFVLTHSGLDGFGKTKKLSAYTENQLLWNRPRVTDRYFDDALTVFGHTPTCCLEGAVPGRAFKTDTWIDIDTGASMPGGHPMLLRLDDLEEFYP